MSSIKSDLTYLAAKEGNLNFNNKKEFKDETNFLKETNRLAADSKGNKGGNILSVISNTNKTVINKQSSLKNENLIQNLSLSNNNNNNNLTNTLSINSSNKKTSNNNLNLETKITSPILPNSNNSDEALVLTDIVYENYIFKSRSNNKLKKYYIALIGQDLFYFSNSKKTKLKGMHNLSGSYIFEDEGIIKVREESKVSSSNNKNANNPSEILVVNYYPFRLNFKKKSRVYYCRKEEECKEWLKVIRKITKFREVTDYYSFGECLGKGKFGSVKLGIDKRNKQRVAIKTIAKANLNGIETEMVKTEIEIMKFCRQRNIVKLIDNFEDYENIYIILEYLSGGNLNNFLSLQETILPEHKIKEIIYQIGLGIKYLHHFGILHRDLKPENLMMSEKNYNTAIVKIVDFGLSKILGITETSNDAYGTLSYAAPEVIQKSDYNNTIDIWSLGVILYFLICGYLPFNDKNNNVNKIANDITKANVKFETEIWCTFSVHAKDLTLKCLEKDSNKRINILELLDHAWFNEN